ncbi:MAG TPA: hypothetical protein VFZ51_08470 [Woeseiaceae bacterium]
MTPERSEPRRATVRIRADRVEKEVGSGAERTAEKYRVLQRIGDECGFRAPGVLDVKGGVISLERLDGIRSVRELYWDAMRRRVELAAVRMLWIRIGEVLAAIHACSPRPGNSDWIPPVGFAADLVRYGNTVGYDANVCSAPLHADFGFANVFFRGAPPWDIVVIDPCADGYSTYDDWVAGPVYVDVGKMLLSLEGKVAAYRQPFLDRRTVGSLQVSFLAGYAAGGARLDPLTAFAYAYALGRCYFAKRYAALRGIAMSTLYNRLWKGNFPWTRKQRQLEISVEA